MKTEYRQFARDMTLVALGVTLLAVVFLLKDCRRTRVELPPLPPEVAVVSRRGAKTFTWIIPTGKHERYVPIAVYDGIGPGNDGLGNNIARFVHDVVVDGPSLTIYTGSEVDPHGSRQRVFRVFPYMFPQWGDPATNNLSKL